MKSIAEVSLSVVSTVMSQVAGTGAETGQRRLKLEEVICRAIFSACRFQAAGEAAAPRGRHREKGQKVCRSNNRQR